MSTTEKAQQRVDKFREDAKKPIQWQQNIRLAGNGMSSYSYINFEAVYSGFRERLAQDQAFRAEILEIVIPYIADLLKETDHA